MENSIIKSKNFRLFIVAAFWLSVWQVFAMIINQELLLAAPFAVVKRIFELSQTSRFWLAAANSLFKIMQGFLLALIIGVLLAACSAANSFFYLMIKPLLHVIKSTPIASFTILALIWIRSENVSVFISFLMSLPVVYFNTHAGIENMDKKLIEMADVFRFSKLKRIRHIYLHAVLPFVLSAASSALGFAWKSGIAAEVIGLQKNTIGILLYEAKLYLETADLFALTAVVVLLSIIMENAFKLLVKLILKREGQGENNHA